MRIFGSVSEPNFGIMWCVGYCVGEGWVWSVGCGVLGVE